LNQIVQYYRQKEKSTGANVVGTQRMVEDNDNVIQKKKMTHRRNRVGRESDWLGIWTMAWSIICILYGDFIFYESIHRALFFLRYNANTEKRIIDHLSTS